MKTIDDYWKELEEVEFDLHIAKQLKDEDMMKKLERKRKTLETKIKNIQGGKNE